MTTFTGGLEATGPFGSIMDGDMTSDFWGSKNRDILMYQHAGSFIYEESHRSQFDNVPCFLSLKGLRLGTLN